MKCPCPEGQELTMRLAILSAVATSDMDRLDFTR